VDPLQSFHAADSDSLAEQSAECGIRRASPFPATAAGYHHRMARHP